MDTGNIEYPTGFGAKDIIAWGNTCMVGLDAVSQTVIKTPRDQTHADSLKIERRIYERFQEHGGHKGLLLYYGPFEEYGICLEYATKFNLCSTLRKSADIDYGRRLLWVLQITNAAAFIHSHNVIHGDPTCSNAFLTDQMDAKLADFGGSSIDGSDLLVAVTESHRYPRELLSKRADIFALGSVIFPIITGTAPYDDFSDNEIDERYRLGQYPDTTILRAIGQVITNCWQARYSSTEDVYNDIKDRYLP